MSTDINRHSRIVGWLKILLPLAALALLSTLFLFARQTGEPNAIPFAELDRLAQEQRITAPRFSGMTDDGHVISISAVAAKPVSPDLLTIEKPRLTLTFAEGTELVVSAGEGELDNATRQARLTGLARLETTSGYVMETTGLTADMANGTIVSHGPLAVQAPFGQLSAGAVAISGATTPDSYRMDFTEGVKLVYTPPTAAELDSR